ncbi:hypothetical protein GIB67_002183 [Kingdonia uniflora]|uniref:HECT-type E3 ubiquitin transferase n=1 Tax=Kingdonia uniflora TaxID=39325 RepID=A0A7J7KWU5_9MAGN|nr:hypothetical protein GIB67_002183 [Kingdonia uniflora]
MESRGRKRAELADEVPADKRACSLTEFRPVSSSSSIQSHIGSMNSASEARDSEMETASSSASVSAQSEGEEEKDFHSDGSDDSNQRPESARRSSVDRGRLKSILSSLSNDVGPDSQLASLTDLCDLLSFSNMSSDVSSSLSNILAPALVSLAKQESNLNISLLAVRAITYLCDALPRSSDILVRHNVVPTLCARLMVIEYLDIAEQCLQALEKISRDHSVVCLQSGAIMAALNYIDFFCTSIQRVALSTVANICKKLPSDCSSHLVEAIPSLCKLLQYEDQKLVENAALCLIPIVERVGHSSQMLDELCKCGLVHQAIHLLTFHGRTTFSQPVYTGIIGMLRRLAHGSVASARTMFELNISGTLKHILSNCDLSHSMPLSTVGDGHFNQVYEVMKLLNELLPSLTGNDDTSAPQGKEKILADYPELLRQIGIDIIPVLIKVVSSGASSNVCYAGLCIIHKLVYFSGSDMFLDFIKDTNFSSFLTGVFTRRDPHVLILALKLVNNVMQKLPNVFKNSFQKEGVIYAIDSLLMPEKCSLFVVPASKDVLCLCYTFGIGQSPSSGTKTCKLENDSVHALAKDVKTSYFGTDADNSDAGFTEILNKLTTFAAILTSLQNGPEDNPDHILGQLLAELNGGEYISTFEFIESGIVKALLSFLSSDHFLIRKVDDSSSLDRLQLVMERLEKFATFSLENLVKKVQSSLSFLENFPIIKSQPYKKNSTYATIPFGRDTTDPCLKVHFTREDGETHLCDYNEEVATVEPFASLDDIEKFLWSKVSSNGMEIDGTEKDNLSVLPDVDIHPKLTFHLEGRQIDRAFTLYQAILIQQNKVEQDIVVGQSFWSKVHKVAYKKAVETGRSNPHECLDGLQISTYNPRKLWQNVMTFELCDIDKLDPTYEFLVLLRILEGLNRFACHLVSRERRRVFSRGENGDLDELTVRITPMPQIEFVNRKLTEKLEQQMKDPSVMSLCQLPSWCSILMAVCPYLFGLEARCKFFRLKAFGSNNNASSGSNNNTSAGSNSRPSRKRLQISRSRILDSAAKVMDSHFRDNSILEIQYIGEVGTGLGPTLEFYTIVSREFLKINFGMWRGHHNESIVGHEDSGYLVASFGLFPRPWSASLSSSKETQFSEVIKKFVLLGKIVAKALQDGRVLDLPLSKAFYKLMLDQELNISDILSFDPELGKVLLEFQALADRKKFLESTHGTSFISESCFRNTRIEDLWLDFSLPGYPDYMLTSKHNLKMVNLINLEEYVFLVVDATVVSGIFRQVEAFKSGFNQVFPITNLQIFTEAELERLLCGEQDAWTPRELLEHINFDHGYTSSSPPIINLLKIIEDFDCDHRRAFLQFVTGAPRLPRGGLAALNPKLTVVRKHFTGEADLPSVMTCANYLKLPPYSCKELVKQQPGSTPSTCSDGIPGENEGEAVICYSGRTRFFPPLVASEISIQPVKVTQMRQYLLKRRRPRKKKEKKEKKIPAKQRQSMQVPEDAEFLDETDDGRLHWTEADLTCLARAWVTASVQTTGHTKGFTFYQNVNITFNKDPECPTRRSSGLTKSQCNNFKHREAYKILGREPRCANLMDDGLNRAGNIPKNVARRTSNNSSSGNSVKSNNLSEDPDGPPTPQSAGPNSDLDGSLYEGRSRPIGQKLDRKNLATQKTLDGIAASGSGIQTMLDELRLEKRQAKKEKERRRT